MTSRFPSRPAELSVLHIVLIYVTFAVLWMIISDELVAISRPGPAFIRWFDMSKGALFVFVTGGLLYLLLRAWRPQKTTLSTIPPQTLSPPRRHWIAISLLCIGLITLVPALGLLIINIQGPQIEQAAYTDLQAIALLKAERIESWLDERQHDALGLKNSTDNIQRMANALRSDNQSDHEFVHRRLKSLIRPYGFSTAMLLDQQGKPRIVEGSDTTISPATQALIDQALSTGEIQHGSFSCEQDAQTHLDFVTPLVLRDHGQPQSLGVVVLRILPKKNLFPLIQHWPGAQTSGKAYLVRRNGTSVELLNEPSDQSHTITLTSHALTELTRVSAKAIRDQKPGVAEGVDYLGVPVLAAYRPIAETDWHIITKINRDEVFAPMNNLLFWVSTVTFLGIIVLGVAMLLLWRKSLQLAHAELTVQANQLFKHFYDLPFLGMTTWAPDTNALLQVNNRFCEIVGYSREELVGMNRQLLSHPEDSALELRELEKLQRGESDGYQLEKRYIRKDGVIVHGKLDARCVRKEDGSVDFMAATIQDITAQKTMQLELLDSEERYRTLADSGQAMIWTAGVDTLCNYFNKVWLDFTGRSLIQELGNGWAEGVHPDDLARCLEIYTIAFKHREKFSMDYRLRRHDGEYRWIQDDGSPCYDREGEFVGYIGYCLDITERYLIRQALTESETKLRTMIGNLPIVLCTIDAEGRFTMSEGKALEKIGLKPGEVVGHSVFDVYHDNPQLLDCIRRSMQGEYIHTEHDIGGIWFESFHQPFSGAGQEAGIMLTSINITARKKAESAMQLSVKRMECLNRITDYRASNTLDLLDYALKEVLAFNGSPVGHIFSFEEKTQELSLVSSSRTTSENKQPATLETTCHGLANPAFWNEGARQRKPIINNDVQALNPGKGDIPEGDTPLRRLMSVPVVANDQTIGLVGFANRQDDYTQTDIDQLSLLIGSVWYLVEQRQAAEALQRATDQLKISQTLAKVGAWEIDTRDNSIYWTDETYRIHETDPGSFKPSIQIALDFYVPDSRQRISQALAKTIDEGCGFDFELELITAKTNHRQVRTSCQAHKENDKVVRISGAIQDITAYKKIDDELRKYQEHLEELVLQRTCELVDARDTAERATKAKSAFLANMSHEIRTPINAVLGMAYLAQRTNLTPKQKSYMDKIMISANLLLGVINDILDFSKIEAGRLELSSNEFLLTNLLDKVIAVISQKAIEKQLEFLVQIAPDTPLSLVGDASRLGQILINLCSNAVKFTDTGDVLLRISRTSKKSEDQVELQFTVKDTGIGLTSDQLAQLFKPFSQADTSDTRRFGGTGLGLAICKELSEMMGGRIWANSQHGHGSEFHITMPFKIGSSVVPQTHQPDANWHGLLALVVDRNTTGREILATLLRGFGFEVITKSSAVAALAQLVSDNVRVPDLLLIDRRELEDEVLLLAKILRERNAKAKIILMSFSSEPIDEVQHAQLAPDAEAFKPITASSLFDAVITAMSEKNAPGSSVPPRHPRLIKHDSLLGARVLLVEDNTFNQQIARELLESAGMEVEIAENGQEALYRATTAPFDIILMDVQMPIMDGLEATRRLRARPQTADIPILAMTAHAMIDEQHHCLEAGMDGFLSKPINPDLLVASIARELHDKTPGKHAQKTEEAQAAPSAPPRLPKSIPGIFIETGLHFCGDNVDFYLRMLKEFMTSKSDTGQKIREALAQADKTTAQRLAHTMKSVSASIGATDLSHISAEFEQMLRQETTSEFSEWCDRFDAALGTVIAGLHSYIDDGSANPSPAPGPNNQKTPLEVAQKIRKCLKTDLGEALGLLPSLSHALNTERETELCKQFSARLKVFDLDNAQPILDELIAELQIAGSQK
ncbi:MAG: multi-sensor hybrid histidine kinase [Proteobacteria bacterium]|nr:multi-sensor hybrid histidine kinase [Pseudomonadota bacterium]